MKPRRRSYYRHGYYTLTTTNHKGRLPLVLARISDPTIPDEALKPVERAIRALREDFLVDLGSDHSTAQIALVDLVVGSVIALQSVDAWLIARTARTGIVGGRSPRVLNVAIQRQRMADSLARQLQALGLEKKKAPTLNLHQYVAEKYGQKPAVEPTMAPDEPSETVIDITAPQAPPASPSPDPPARTKRTPVRLTDEEQA
jgi:hypothetical protein